MRPEFAYIKEQIDNVSNELDYSELFQKYNFNRSNNAILEIHERVHNLNLEEYWLMMLHRVPPMSLRLRSHNDGDCIKRLIAYTRWCTKEEIPEYIFTDYEMYDMYDDANNIRACASYYFVNYVEQMYRDYQKSIIDGYRDERRVSRDLGGWFENDSLLNEIKTDDKKAFFESEHPDTSMAALVELYSDEI